MPFLIGSVVLQVALVLHIVKTGRSTTWIWIVVMLPMAGSIAYLVLEVIPDIAASKTGRSASKKISQTVNPDKDLKKAIDELSVADTVENSIRLADELLSKNMFDEAKSLYERCLKGVHETDPIVMSGLAKAEFELKNYSRAKNLLDKLIEHNPDYKNADAHLLYARVLEQLGDEKAALHEYEVLHGYYSGPEATFRYALLLQHLGDNGLANALFREIVKRAKNAGDHYNAIHKEWIKKAKTQISN